jgi:hypothetical protein
MYEENVHIQRLYFSFGKDKCAWCDSAIKFGVDFTVVNLEIAICDDCANKLSADLKHAATHRGWDVDIVLEAGQKE